MEKVLFSWSGGKDSSLALFEVLHDGQFQVAALFTTLTETEKVPMHEVSGALIEEQADSLGLKFVPVYLPEHANNEMYERRLSKVLARFKQQGVEKVIHADIYLEDIKLYRDRQLAQLNLTGVYPLWGKDTAELAQQFIARGFKSVVTCVDTSVLGKEFAGRGYDREFLSDLPEGVDPCGENGEFHTFVYDGPIFEKPISFKQTGTYTTWEGRFYHVALE